MKVAERLIQELCDDPTGCLSNRTPYKLLQEYINGYPVATLRDLLRHEDIDLLKTVVWIASELGTSAYELIDDVIPLLKLKNRHISWFVLDVLIVCANGQRAGEFEHVVRSLAEDDERLAAQAAWLIERSSKEQLRASRVRLKASASHDNGLGLLLLEEAPDRALILRMLCEQDVLTRRYAAIIIRKFGREDSELLETALASTHSDVRAILTKWPSV